jgi:hypothetical protein
VTWLGTNCRPFWSVSVQTLCDPTVWNLEKRAVWLHSTRLAVTTSQLLCSLFQLEVVIEADERLMEAAAEAAPLVLKPPFRPPVCFPLAYMLPHTHTHTVFAFCVLALVGVLFGCGHLSRIECACVLATPRSSGGRWCTGLRHGGTRTCRPGLRLSTCALTQRWPPGCR